MLFLPLFLEKQLTGLINIARADGQDDVARLRNAAQIGRDLRERLKIDRARHLGGQIARGDADLVALARGVDLRQHGQIDALQLRNEVGEERLGARVGVRLEGHHDALIAHGLHRVDQRVQLAGMMGIVVVDVRAVEPALALHAASRAGEAEQPLCDVRAVHAEHIGRGRRAQRVIEA